MRNKAQKEDNQNSWYNNEQLEHADKAVSANFNQYKEQLKTYEMKRLAYIEFLDSSLIDLKNINFTIKEEALNTLFRLSLSKKAVLSKNEYDLQKMLNDVNNYSLMHSETKNADPPKILYEPPMILYDCSPIKELPSRLCEELIDRYSIIN